jgi:TolA-binding protein
MPNFPAALVAVAVALVAMPLAGIAHAQSREQQQTFAELRMLQEQTQRLQQSVNLIAEQLKTLADQVKAVNTRVDAQSDQTVKSAADLRDMVVALTRSVSTLEQRIGENNIRVQQIEQEITPIRTGLAALADAVTAALQSSGTMSGAGATSTSGGSASGGGVALPPSPNDLFQQAMGFYMTPQYDLAIKAFQDYLKQFPDAPNACKAQKTIGDSHVGQNKLTEAVADYDVVIKQYKGTDCEPDAYFAQGKVYEQLKQVAKATANYQYIRKTAADKTSEAWQNADALARQALDRLAGIKK